MARIATTGQVRSVAFSPDGRRLAAGQVDGRTRIWKTDGWRPEGAALALRKAPVLGVDFTLDPRTLATSHSDGRAVLWDVASQKPLGIPLPGSEGFWVNVRFTPDGKRLFTLDDHGRGFLWTIDPARWKRQACSISGGGLSRKQWDDLLEEQKYRPVCRPD